MHNCPNCGSPVEMLDVSFDCGAGLVRAGDKDCKLTKTLMDIFECFFDAYPKGVTVSELYDEVFRDRDPDKMPSLDNVRTHITRLRDAFAHSRMPLEIYRVTGSHKTESAYLLVSTADAPEASKVA